MRWNRLPKKTFFILRPEQFSTLLKDNFSRDFFLLDVSLKRIICPRCDGEELLIWLKRRKKRELLLIKKLIWIFFSFVLMKRFSFVKKEVTDLGCFNYLVMARKKINSRTIFKQGYGNSFSTLPSLHTIWCFFPWIIFSNYPQRSH